MEPQQQEQEIIQQNQNNNNHMLYIRLMSKRRTWVALYIILYGIFLYFSWNILQSILTWYNATLQLPAAEAGGGGWAAAAYAAAMLGTVFGIMSMAAAFAMAVPAMLVIWITILVLLTFCGKGRKDVVVQGKKLTAEIVGVVAKILIKEGNFVAAVCAVLGYFLLVRKSSFHDDDF